MCKRKEGIIHTESQGGRQERKFTHVIAGLKVKSAIGYWKINIQE